MGEEIKIGSIFSYYSKIGVAAVNLTEGDLKVGDTIHIKGSSTDFTQKVESIQIEHDSVEEATKGQEVGIKVSDKVRPNDTVFKVIE